MALPFVLTYTTLTNAVITYLERTDTNFVSQIPLFIMLAERTVARDLKILGLKNAITADLIPGNGVFSKPTRWLNDSSFNIGTGTTFHTRKYLLQRSVEYCRQYWPDPTKTSTPKYYASDYSYDAWFVVPTPDIAYPYEILYYETPELIGDAVATNFLTQNAPEILIYATMLEAVRYLKDDERIKVWQDAYDKSYKSLGAEDIGRIQDAFSKRGG
jgi:hypothetical protein